MAREDQAAAARAAIYARLEREVDPQGKLSPDERGRLKIFNGGGYGLWR